MKFSSFHTSENRDILYVYSGRDTAAANLIGELTGQSGYGTISSIASDGSLTFWFKSDIVPCILNIQGAGK